MAIKQKTASIVAKSVVANRIPAVAKKRFVAQGYHVTTTVQIAVDAELIDEAPLHHHFCTKSDLLLRLLVRAEEDVLFQTVQRVATACPSAKDKLLAFLDERVLLGRSYLDDSLLRILMSIEFQNPADALA
ncbi:MAG: hypothetical protein EXQ91_03525 [Alphaproteobacteria bacterium]|nr:hypothetical protein [Alphaproteobacteria bacterium]